MSTVGKGVKTTKGTDECPLFSYPVSKSPLIFFGSHFITSPDASCIWSVAGVCFHLFWQEDCFVGWAYNTVLKAVADRNITIRIRTIISFVIAIIFPLFDP